MMTERSNRVFITTRKTIDIETGEVLAHEGYWYDGPLMLCGAPPPGQAPGAEAAGGAETDALTAGAEPAGTEPAEPAGETQGTAADAAAAQAGEGEPAEGAEAAPAEGEAQPAEGESAVEGEQPPEGQAAAPAQPAKPLTPEQQAMEKTLGELYRERPELKEYLKLHPQDRPMFFKAVEFNKRFKTLEDADTALQYARDLSALDQQFFSDKPEDTNLLLDRLWKLSTGTFDAQGQFTPGQATGAYERMSHAVVSRVFNNLHAGADKLNLQTVGWTPEQFRLALEGLAAVAGIDLAGAWGTQGGSSAAAPAAAGRGAAVGDQREQALLRREQEIARRESAIKEQRETAFLDTMTQHLQNHLIRETDLVLKPAAKWLATQSKRAQQDVRAHIAEEVASAIDNDALFQAQYDAQLRGGDRGPQHVEALKSLLESRVALYFPEIAAAVLRDYGYQAIAAQQVKERVQEQAAARREPATTGSPGRLSGGPARPKRKPSGVYREDAMAILEGKM